MEKSRPPDKEYTVEVQFEDRTTEIHKAVGFYFLDACEKIQKKLATE